MKTKVTIDSGVVAEITQRRPGLTTTEEVVTVVVDAQTIGEQMTSLAIGRLNSIINRKRRDIRDAWKADNEIMEFFGGNPTIAQIKSVRRRLERADRRLGDRELKIRLRSQSDAPSSESRGRNLGGALSPNKFQLFPEWFLVGRDERAAIVVHELFHDWFADAKVKHDGQRVTVRGANLARELADEKPATARINPENYEQFCLAVFRLSNNLKELAEFRSAPPPRAPGDPRRTKPVPPRAGGGPRRTKPDPAPRRTKPVPPRAG